MYITLKKTTTMWWLEWELYFGQEFAQGTSGA
jgi:hypothetical protein